MTYMYVQEYKIFSSYLYIHVHVNVFISLSFVSSRIQFAINFSAIWICLVKSWSRVAGLDGVSSVDGILGVVSREFVR